MAEFNTSEHKLSKYYLQIAMVLAIITVIYNFIPVRGKTKTFYLPSSNPDKIIKTLKKYGYNTVSIDTFLLRFVKKPQKGWYTIDHNYNSRLSFFENLHKMKTDALMQIVIYAGETKEELSKRLANDMKLDKNRLLKDFNALTRFQEGDILASTYTVARKADENATIQFLFDTSYQQLKEFENKNIYIGHKKRTLKELVIIASIIQKESNSILEMPLISAVIHNRLNKNIPLQMDATLNYGPYAHTVVSKDRIKNDNTLYNTYKHKGLPPHPLSSITMNALNATLKPAKKAYLFFMLTPSGAHDFSQTYKEHLEKVNIFRDYQAQRKKLKNQENNKSDSDKDSNHTKSSNTFGIKKL